MSDYKLLPCPFCGGEADIRMVNDGGNYVAGCTKCPADVGRWWYWTKKEAANAWNTRAQLSRQKGG